MSEMWKWSAVEVSQRIKSGSVSVREVTQANLDRLNAVNPVINAVTEMVSEALDVADEMDAGGVPEDAGPLYGVPVTTKINVDQKGCVNSNGVPALKDNVGTEDSPVVSNLRKAGAVLIGRTNAPEFSMRYFTSNGLHGNTLNPWDKTRTPGGSSGGAAAAVVAGIGAIAHGNDLAGSLRHPAFCCGVTSIRPSFGRVPAFNPSAAQERPGLTQTMSVQGPIARSVADLRASLQVMSMKDSRDPMWVNAQDSGRSRTADIRIGYCTNPFDAPIDPAQEKAIEIATIGLRDCGIYVEEMTLPNPREAARLWGVLAMGETSLLLGDNFRTLVSDEMKHSFEVISEHYGVFDDPATLLKAIRDRVTYQRNWSLMFDDIDLLLMPTSLSRPFPKNEDFEKPATAVNHMIANQPLSMINTLGLPSVALPTHLSDGVPAGVQLIGALHDDWYALDIAERLEKELGTLWQDLPELV